MRFILLSIFYRSVRYIVTNYLYLFQNIFGISKNLEPAVKFGDNSLSNIFFLKRLIYDFETPKNKSIEIFNMQFSSCIIGSSFKSDPRILDIWMRMGLGGLIFKTIMEKKRAGNLEPRLQDANYENLKGLYNSIGLPGMGIKKFLKYLEDTELWKYKRPLGVSIGGDNEKEYLSNIVYLNNFLKKKEGQFFYELNISCPNTKNGKTICELPSSLETLLKKIRIETLSPISVKISPDISNEKLQEIAEICEGFEMVMINAGNTQYKTPEQVGVKVDNFSMKGGGLSGSPLFKRTVEMVTVLNSFNIPIIATGGISNIYQIRHLNSKGASLFGMASSLVLDPYCIPKIHSKL